MKKVIINSTTKKWWNTLSLPDGWTGAEGEWQMPNGFEEVPVDGGTGYIWNGTSFDAPPDATPDLLAIWKADMAGSDPQMSRIEEDIIGVLSTTAYNNLPAETKTKYNDKVALRATKPV